MRYSWRHFGFVSDAVPQWLSDHLKRQPDGRLVLAIHTIQWRVFGQATVFGRTPGDDEEYLSILRNQILPDAQPIAGRLRDRTAEWIQSRVRCQSGTGRELSEADKRLANLARYLSIPMGDSDRVSRLVEAAESYFVLQLAGLPGQHTKDDLAFADCETHAQQLEGEIYRHLLEGMPLQAKLPARHYGWFWHCFLRLYEATCRSWRRLPALVQRLLCVSTGEGGSPDLAQLTELRLTDAQRALTQFVAQPTADTQNLLQALPKGRPQDATTRRLTWLAIAKWIQQIQQEGAFAHEILIDAHTQLRRQPSVAWVWNVEPVFENQVHDQQNFLESWCTLQIGAAWKRAQDALASLQLHGEYERFARRLALSNFDSVKAAHLCPPR